jgi:hypothetical protein
MWRPIRQRQARNTGVHGDIALELSTTRQMLTASSWDPSRCVRVVCGILGCSHELDKPLIAQQRARSDI